jgi:hypothetical protein
MQKTFFLTSIVLALIGCGKEQGVPGRDDRVQTARGTPGATPNQEFTLTNSNEGTSVPRDGGSLDRGATRDNKPIQNAPGTDGKALDASGTGTGKETR